MFSAADWHTLCSVHGELILFSPTCYPSNLDAEAAPTGVDPYIHMLVLRAPLFSMDAVSLQLLCVLFDLVHQLGGREMETCLDLKNGSFPPGVMN